jgi:hypothetical protein
MNTLALSLVPFVDAVAARLGKSRQTTLKLMLACEVVETAVVLALVAALVF